MTAFGRERLEELMHALDHACPLTGGWTGTAIDATCGNGR